MSYTIDGGTIRDNHTHLLMRYSPFEPSDGYTNGQNLIGRFSEIDGLRISRSRSGKAALIVTGMVDNSTVRTVFVVHPRRGLVWRGFNSRVVGLRNGRAVVAQYNPEQDAPSNQPIRVLYLDLDQLLKRPVIQSSIDKSLPAGE
ncbi:MAG: hypothetical protein EOP06_28125 [Proteobacteria bacterium]|nr:MAG: hypothetical protein EOP06_28125 [Pseudomonadota bacterium]